MSKAECRWNSPEQWSQWSAWLAVGLHGRNRWRLPVLLVGMLFAGGRRTVTTWLRAAGVSDDYQDYYYFLVGVGRKSESIATQLLGLVRKSVRVAWIAQLLSVARQHSLESVRFDGRQTQVGYGPTGSAEWSQLAERYALKSSG
jgi:hypothetical protein